MKLKSIEDVVLEHKRVLLRADFNVPIKSGKVADDYKIIRTLPTIKYLLKNKCQIILVSHLGRPDGKTVSSLSLAPVCADLRKHLPGANIHFIKNKINAKLVTKVRQDFKNDDILFLENIRFDKREEENSLEFAAILAKLARVYVNEAFAVSHRACASMVAISRFIPCFAGLNVSAEVAYLSKALSPKSPSIALIGGAKIKTKMKVVDRFLKIYDQVLFGGGCANTILLAKGFDVGGSLVKKKEAKKIKPLLKSKKIILPIDLVVCGKNIRRKPRVVEVGKNKKLCAKSEMIFDIGPATMKLYSNMIRQAKTIIWGGPMGLLEDKRFVQGSIVVAKAIGAVASGRALGIAGGGETLYAIHMAKAEKYFDFVSTGGGAMLAFLEGKELPGLQAIKQ